MIILILNLECVYYVYLLENIEVEIENGRLKEEINKISMIVYS